MKKILLHLFFISCFNNAFAQTVFPGCEDGKIYVKFTKSSLKSVSKEDPRNIPLEKLSFLTRIFTKYGVTRVSKPFYQASDDEILPCILKFEFSKIGQVNDLITELGELSVVEYAEKVHLNKTDAVPNDPLFATASGSTHLNQINAQNAWNVFNGNSNITVAIVDNAVMSTHADLAANIYTNTAEASGITGIDDDGNGYIDDVNGYDVAHMDAITNPTSISQEHGTHCAGIAGGVSNNSTGIASIGWNIRIIPVKCSFDASPNLTVNFGYEGIIYAVKARARIISCSWGNNVGSSLTEQYCIDYAWNRGCIIIASAGNFGNSIPNYPGAYNHVYCVAAVNPSDVKSGYSNYGSWVDISAPGDNIMSTIPYVSTPAYNASSGTSMATPLVAGLAALMLSKSPNMTRTDVLNCISSTAVNIYTLGGNSSYTGLLGAGRIEAFQAMNCAATYSALPPVAGFYAFPLNTCPNTPVPFTDSSLYAPTSWSWVFQGGTPATSTLANPSVQWSATGTYSVSLTVGNANGSDTKTKLSYITVSGPVALPFSEGFQSIPFLPANWTPNNLWNDNLYWARVTGIGGFGTSTACAVFDNYVMNAPGERDEMRTPKFDFSNVAKARLRFDVAYARYDPTYSDSLEVKISTNCGVSWTNIYLKGGTNLSTAPDQSSQFSPASTQWRTDTVDISIPAAGQSNVMFSFINRGHYGQPIYLDNINLFFPTPTLTAIHPTSVCEGSTQTFTNTSAGAASYTWNFPGGLPASSTATNPSVSYPGPGTFTVTLLGVNGTSTASLTKTVVIVPIPTVGISASPAGSICAGGMATLSASGASSYTWNNTGTGPSSILVIPTATGNTYTLSGSVGACISSTVITFTVIPNPVSVLSTSNSLCSDACSGMVTAATSGGPGPYSYSLNTGTCTSLPCTNLCAGAYSLVTINASGCSSGDLFSISAPALLQSAVSATNTSCGSCPDGALIVSTTGGTGPYTYTWLPSGGNSANAMGLLPGCYTVNIQDANNCTSFTTACVMAGTGLQTNVPKGSLLIYPNPAKDHVTIEYQGMSFHYVVYNNLGQWIRSGKNNQHISVIDLSGFAKGTYLVEVEVGTDKIRKKLVVE